MRQFCKHMGGEMRKRLQPVQAGSRRNDFSSENKTSCQLDSQPVIQGGRLRSLKQLCGGVGQAATTQQQRRQIHAHGRVVRAALNQQFQHLAGCIESLRLDQLPCTPAKIQFPDFLVAIHFQTIGSFNPISRAHSFAISYPASACRMTPVPGSFHSTRAMRLSAASEPSHTITTPLCCE